MSLPSLDGTNTMEMPMQSVPVLQPLSVVTPMDTSPSPAIGTAITNTVTNTMSTGMSMAGTIQGMAPSTVPVLSAGTMHGIPAANNIQGNTGMQVVQKTSVINTASSASASSSSVMPALKNTAAMAGTSSPTTESPAQLLSRARLQDLVREVDPTEQLDEEIEELLMQLADDFVETTVSAACLLAKHRKANTIDVKDVQLHLERNWNMWIPGFGTDELRPYKRAAVTEAHKQRLALIRKALKKY